MAVIKGEMTRVTYNDIDISKYIDSEALDLAIAEIETTTIPGTFSDTFAAPEPVTITLTVRFTVRYYQHHCNKHLRNRLQLAPYRRVRWSNN